MIISVHPSLPVGERLITDQGQSRQSTATPQAEPARPDISSASSSIQPGLDLVHVPFQSAGLAVQSAIGNHADLHRLAGAHGAASAGRQVVGARGHAKVRSQALPNILPWRSLAIRTSEGENWFGFIVPAGTPKEIVALLHREIVKLARCRTSQKSSTRSVSSLWNTPTNSRPKSSASCRNGQSLSRRASRRSNSVRTRGGVPLASNVTQQSASPHEWEQNTNALH